METPPSTEKPGREQEVQYASSYNDGPNVPERTQWEYLKHYFTSREGWLGDYVRPPLQASDPKLTFSGLSLPHHAQHLALEPQISRL